MEGRARRKSRVWLGASRIRGHWEICGHVHSRNEDVEAKTMGGCGQMILREVGGAVGRADQSQLWREGWNTGTNL